jgi:2,4-dienoyl-CoA reductase (NADPH2)
MHTGLEARPDGTARLAAFYAERASGGAALIAPADFPNDAGELSPHRAQMSTGDAQRHAVIPKTVHDAGGRIVLQILHSGRYGFHQNIVAPSPIKSGINPNPPREMGVPEIEQTIADFVRAAVLAQTAGYDGVEIMGSEGYLITQFLRCAPTSARTNGAAR